MSQTLPNMLESAIAKIREMVDVNSVIGNPITTPDGVTIITVSKVSVGFGGGIGSSGNGLFRIFRTADTEGSDTITSLYEKNSKAYESNFAELLSVYEQQANDN